MCPYFKTNATKPKAVFKLNNDMTGIDGALVKTSAVG